MESTYKIILDEVKRINRLIEARDNLTTAKRQVFFNGEGDEWEWFNATLHAIHKDLHFGFPDDQIYRHVQTSLDLIEETLTHLADVYVDIDESHPEWESIGEMPSYDVFHDLSEALKSNGGLDVAPVYTFQCMDWLASCAGLRIETTEEVLSELSSAGIEPNLVDAIQIAFNREFGEVLFPILTAIEGHLIEVHMHGDSRFSE